MSRQSAETAPASGRILPLTPAEGARITVALAGNPNAGKTTLFNTLTGARQHVGNYPGVTVEKKEGSYQHGSTQVHVVDLPGTYSLSAYSVEEVVARDYLLNERPEVVVNIADAANLERNLYLTCQFLEMGAPMVIALNMMDVARDRGIEIDPARLSALIGVPVVPIIARSGQGKAELSQAVIERARAGGGWRPWDLSYGEDIDAVLLAMVPEIEEAGFLTSLYPARWTALKYLEGDAEVMARGRQADSALAGRLEDAARKLAAHLEQTIATHPEALIADHRYGYIKSILRQGVISHHYDADRLYLSDRIDKVVTNRFLGPLIMLAILFILYHLTFTYSKVPVGWFESLFGWLGNAADTLLPAGPVKSLLVAGVIHGVGGVLGFVPIIMFMFLGIAVLEDSGYLARVAFMMDRVFRIFGLHGNSVMAYIVSGGIAGGCAVPGVMATRTLKSPKERMATLLTVPMMNCGAKLPVMALLTAAFFAAHEAQVMLGLTLLAWTVSLLVAKLLRSTILRGASTPFVMELPPYRLPTFKGLAIHTWERTWQYVRKAGTVILGISILLWAMMTFPGLPAAEQARFAAQRETARAGAPAGAPAQVETGAGELSPAARELKQQLLAIDAAQAQQALRLSIAGRIGTALEKVSRLAGFDWRTNIALVGGFAAKEVVVSTLGTAYSLGNVDPEESTPLATTLARSWTPLMGLAAMVFIMFYSPCFVTVVCIVRETGSWKWGLFSIAFNTLFAFTLATAVYQLGSLVWAG
ncbi:MAG: ferrous iron transport protein B [Desulfobacteraceae bacterium]|nr:ferrous iron transport protein B [Desulfobacteraceae bacterium]